VSISPSRYRKSSQSGPGSSPASAISSSLW
jgi:hypothetical protein